MTSADGFAEFTTAILGFYFRAGRKHSFTDIVAEIGDILVRGGHAAHVPNFVEKLLLSFKYLRKRPRLLLKEFCFLR
jgi:hypothetical protein